MTVCSLERQELKRAEDEAINARRAKLSALRNAMKRDAVMSEVIKNGGVKNAAETIRSLLHGSNKFARDNVESNWHGRRDQWVAVVNNELYKMGYKKLSESGQLDKEVSVAWWNLSEGKPPGKGPAADIAKLFMRAMDNMRDKLNDSGAWIGDAKGYVTETRHSAVKIRAAAGDGKTPDEAFQSWWSKTKPLMAAKNFDSVDPTPEAQEVFGRNLFDAFVTEVHIDSGGAADTGFINKDFLNTSNVAKNISQHRTILWKDGASWNEYMKNFGTDPTLHASVMMAMDRGARSIALMDKFGTNPAANLNMVLRKVQEAYRGDVDEVKKFQNKVQGIQNVMGRLDGNLNKAANMGLANFGSSVRNWESMSMLGGVGITHLASVWPTVTSELAHHGINRLSGLGNTLKALTQGMGDAARRDILADLGAYADGSIRHVQGQLGDDTLPGRISSWANRFMDFTGIHALFDRTKAGVRDMLSHNLARNLSNDFDKLEPHLQQMLGKYRISPDEWKLMQPLQDGLPRAGERGYLTPSAAAQGIDRDAIERQLTSQGKISSETPPEGVEKEVDRYRSDLSDKLLSYYSDASAHAVVSPGVRERALLLGSTKPGTGSGELLRFLTQFKMWPVAAMNQILEREVYMSLSRGEAAMNIGKLVAIGVPAGYMRMAINDLATGRPTRDPSDPKTLLAAAAQSGGLGIFGDFLFGETSRMGGGLISTLGGPVASDADTLVQLFNKAKNDLDDPQHHKNGQFSDIWPDLAHFAVRHVPFANLVYLKGALDYMLWYHLYEAASPGWWERTNRRMQKEQGRTMTGYVPGSGVPWGVPGVHLNTDPNSINGP